MLTVDNVSKFYGQRQAALSNISFTLQKGEMIFLIGSSGAGKSTLLRLIFLEEKPSSGSIVLGPFNLSKIKKNEIPKLRRHVGVAFQDSRLIPERTVAQNVALALEVAGKKSREIARRTDDSLKLAGIWHKRNNYPGQLSGGEAQRVALARAMVTEPLVLLADEPTGNLDEQNAQDLFNLLREYNQRGATIIVATHQLGMAEKFDLRTLRLVSGVLEKDSPKDSIGK